MDDWKALEEQLGLPASELDSRGWRDSGSVGKLLRDGRGNETSELTYFNALMSGFLVDASGFDYKGSDVTFWCSSPTEELPGYRWIRQYMDGINRNFMDVAKWGFSVRCVMDK